MQIRHVSHAENHMATTFELCISCEASDRGRAAAALEDSHRLIDRLERELSEYLEESPVHRLNRSAPGVRVRFTSVGIDLLERSERLHRQTSGAFDATAKGTRSSSDARVRGVAWDRGSREVWKTQPGAMLGFGAIGKGYAIDQVRLLIESRGFSHYLLSAGGASIALSGFAGPGAPWSWAWSWKKDPSGADLGGPFSHELGTAIAIGVSGTHEKGEHIIEPDSGARPRSALSTLITHPSATDADALSTALFVSGWESGLRQMNESLIQAPGAAMIDREEVPRWNGIFQRLFKVPGQWIAGMLLLFSLTPELCGAEETIDLSTLGADRFTPYVTERNPLWILLPAAILIAVLFHLRRFKIPMKPTKSSQTKQLLLVLATCAFLESAHAVEIEPMGKALMAILKTVKVSAKDVPGSKSGAKLYYTKAADGAVERAAFIEHGTYPPDCTHTWAIGIHPKTSKVTEVRVIEMSCPHAFPTKTPSFLEQFKGKGPADAKTLVRKVDIVAKATGSSKLAAEAVVRSIQNWGKLKKKL